MLPLDLYRQSFQILKQPIIDTKLIEHTKSADAMKIVPEFFQKD